MSELLPEGSRFAVLASGSGTNLQALLDAYPGNLVVVAGGKKEAFAFERARRAGVLVEHVDPAGFVGNADYDRELAARIEVHDVELDLERVGDHATNIAEMVYYAATGQHMADRPGKSPKL